MLYYRKDAFEKPGATGRSSRRSTASSLPCPAPGRSSPRVAEFFTGWAWGPTGRAGFGFQSATWERAYIEQQWAPMMASAGGKLVHARPQAGWNNAAGVRALRDLKSLLAFAPPGSTSLSWNQTMENIFARTSRWSSGTWTSAAWACRRTPGSRRTAGRRR
jgi:hypothetical protein